MKARDNPFRVERILSIRYEPQGWTFDQLMDRLKKLNYRGAIVGPEGSGKTTLLEDLEPHLAKRNLAAKYLRLNREHRSIDGSFFESISASDVICFDGCEQLSDRAWCEFQKRTQHACGLIVTTHSPGRLATLVECSTTSSLLGRIIERLVGPNHPVHVESLFRKHGGNLRDALRDLYDQM
jgi:Ni2+-binding GTPase involved in maturation of urease and hydrogenase